MISLILIIVNISLTVLLFRMKAKIALIKRKISLQTEELIMIYELTLLLYSNSDSARAVRLDGDQ